MSNVAQETAARCAEQLYENDAASKSLGICVESIGPGTSRLTMLVRPDMLNGYESCHGGFIFSLADSAFAFACNAYDQITVAQGCNIEFLSPGRLGDLLIADAREKSRGRTTGLYEVEVSREDGKKIALFWGKSFSTGQKLLPE